MRLAYQAEVGYTERGKKDRQMPLDASVAVSSSSHGRATGIPKRGGALALVAAKKADRKSTKSRAGVIRRLSWPVFTDQDCRDNHILIVHGEALGTATKSRPRR